MKATILAVLSAAAVVSAMAGCTAGSGSGGGGQALADTASPPRTLRAFGSEEELAAVWRELREEMRREQRRLGREEAMPSMAAEPEAAAPVTLDEAESVTNVQHAGVDEGGIVKVHGDHLVMLRRGRLFTVKIGDGDLRPVSAVDAFGPDVDPRHAWYDEMLVSGDRVVVIGYSYERGGTEVGLFHIAPDGTLRHRSTHHLRSNDYYSSRNYASRLVGGKLVFYTPLHLPLHSDDPFEGFPGVRRWRGPQTDSTFRMIVPPTRVFRPEHRLHLHDLPTLHTVTVCDLERDDLECQGSAVLGPAGRVFYVSPGAVYVWVTRIPGGPEGGREDDDAAAPTASMVYRMPLDGSAPSALTVSGAPVDQFSFLEDGDGHLNVVVRSESGGDGMWDAEGAAGDVALLRVPVSSFGDGTEAAPASRYRPLPTPEAREGDAFQNRFVGAHLLYGTGAGWYQAGGTESSRRLYVVPLAGDSVAELPLPHGVDRIEGMGTGAVVVGTDGRDLHFSGVELGAAPRLAHRYTQAGASQGETRSHGFFYRAEGPNSGLLGLPVRGPGRPGYEHLFEESASILFLRNDAFRLRPLGELDARPDRAADDACRASCVDWYGNARPLFVRGRILALLGYEIVEGALENGRLREVRRVSYAPRGVTTAAR